MTLGTVAPGCTGAGYQPVGSAGPPQERGGRADPPMKVVTALHRPAALLAGMLACAGLLAFAEWSGGGDSGRPSVPVVRITERDFHIRAPRRLAPGRVRLEVKNDGPD